MNELPDDYLETYRERVSGRLHRAMCCWRRGNILIRRMHKLVIAGDRTHIEEQAALFGDVETFDAQGKSHLISGTR